MTQITGLEAFLVITIPVVLVVISFYAGFISGRAKKDD